MLDLIKRGVLLGAVGCLAVSAGGCASDRFGYGHVGSLVGGSSVTDPTLYEASAISVMLRDAGPDEADDRLNLVIDRLRDSGFEPVYYAGPRVVVLRPGGKSFTVHYALRFDGKRVTLAPLMARDRGLGQGAGVQSISLAGMRSDLRQISEKVTAALSN